MKKQEETHVLNKIRPTGLKVELKDASVNLTNLYYVVASASSQRLHSDDNLRYKQAQEKADLLNAQLQKKGKRWVAGVTSMSLLTYEQKKAKFVGKVLTFKVQNSTKVEF